MWGFKPLQSLDLLTSHYFVENNNYSPEGKLVNKLTEGTTATATLALLSLMLLIFSVMLVYLIISIY
jgi:hypothetical protein